MKRASLVILLTLAAACSSPRSTDTTPAPVSVRTATVTMQHVARTFETGGVVRARTTATLASRITASIVAVHVSAGDRVKAGEPLVTFDGRDLDANRARAASEVTALERGHAAALSNRAAAEAELMFARSSHGRIAALHAHDAATPQQLDEAVSALRVAEARLAAADAQGAATLASLESARQAEAAARAMASYATLTAPFDGIITERLVDPGALATPGVPLLRIDDPRSFRLEVIVDESRLPSVNKGATVDVLLDGDDAEDAAGTTLKATIAEISRAVDSGSHSFRVKLELPGARAMQSGMFARARFATGMQDVLTVPLAAVVAQGQLSTIFVVTGDQRAQMRVIDTGMRTAEWVEALAGVSAGERVIVSPAALRDGAPVRASETDARR